MYAVSTVTQRSRCATTLIAILMPFVLGAHIPVAAGEDKGEQDGHIPSQTMESWIIKIATHLDT